MQHIAGDAGHLTGGPTCCTSRPRAQTSVVIRTLVAPLLHTSQNLIESWLILTLAPRAVLNMLQCPCICQRHEP